MSQNKTEKQRRQFEYLPLSLHIETLGGLATPLVLRGTPLPATRSDTFSTASADQTSVEVKVLLGESPLSEKNQLLGRFHLQDIPKAPRGAPQIKVKFTVDKTCRLTATASLNNSQLSVESQLNDIQKYLTDDAIARALTRAEAEKSEDQQRVSIIEARNSASAAMESAEILLSGSEQISGERERRINERLAALGLALDSDILERIHVATQELRDALGSTIPISGTPFNEIFKDLFGTAAKPAVQSAPTKVTRSKPQVAVKKPGRLSGKLTTDHEPTRSPKNLPQGKIFGGGDFTLDSSLCFVLMPFATKFEAIYEDHIRRIVTEAGLSSQRADEIASTNLITWDIWERLNTARFVIADLTDRNPNVFYEVGLAHAISKEVILLTQSMGDIPFDLQSLRFIVYEYSPRGMLAFEKKLRSAITAVLQAS